MCCEKGPVDTLLEEEETEILVVDSLPMDSVLLIRGEQPLLLEPFDTPLVAFQQVQNVTVFAESILQVLNKGSNNALVTSCSWAPRSLSSLAH